MGKLSDDTAPVSGFAMKNPMNRSAVVRGPHMATERTGRG